MDKGTFIPCQCCGQQYVGESWTWYVCDKCGYRICMSCQDKHSGPYGHGGFKCSQCMTGQLHLVHGIRSGSVQQKPTSKLDEYLSKLRGEQSEPMNRCEAKSDSSFHTEHSANSYNRSTSISQGIIFTNTSLIARKYKNTSAQDVRDIIINFMLTAEEYDGLHWELVDLGDEEMKGCISKNAE